MEKDWFEEMAIIAETHLVFIDDEYIPYWICWEDNSASYRAALKS